uniref:Angiopoietin 2a n=1 Tax=Cyclopterus lumpus TaxID=8103 RepID=A0A8C3AEP9_CYCLU
MTLCDFLEKKVDEMEEQRQVERKMLRDEKEQLQALILRQTAIIGELELQLLKVSSNNTGLQRQQQELLDTVNNLIHTISVSSARGESDTPTTFMDCAAVFKSGNTQSGVYTLTLPNTTIEVKAFCDMETEGGGWTVLQKRFDGHVDFHRTVSDARLQFCLKPTFYYGQRS